MLSGGVEWGITVETARERFRGRGGDLAAIRLAFLLLRIFRVVLFFSLCLLLLGRFSFLALYVFVCRGVKTP